MGFADEQEMYAELVFADGVVGTVRTCDEARRIISSMELLIRSLQATKVDPTIDPFTGMAPRVIKPDQLIQDPERIAEIERADELRELDRLGLSEAARERRMKAQKAMQREMLGRAINIGKGPSPV